MNYKSRRWKRWGEKWWLEMDVKERGLYGYLEDRADACGFVVVKLGVTAGMVGITEGEVVDFLRRMQERGLVVQKPCEEGVKRVWLRRYWGDWSWRGLPTFERGLRESMKKYVDFRDEFMREYPKEVKALQGDNGSV